LRVAGQNLTAVVCVSRISDAILAEVPSVYLHAQTSLAYSADLGENRAYAPPVRSCAKALDE
jgi:hypothetical protein